MCQSVVSKGILCLQLVSFLFVNTYTYTVHHIMNADCVDLLTLTVNFKRKTRFYCLHCTMYIAWCLLLLYCLTTSIQINVKWLTALVIIMLNDL